MFQNKSPVFLKTYEPLGQFFWFSQQVWVFMMESAVEVERGTAPIKEQYVYIFVFMMILIIIASVERYVFMSDSSLMYSNICVFPGSSPAKRSSTRSWIRAGRIRRAKMRIETLENRSRRGSDWTAKERRRNQTIRRRRRRGGEDRINPDLAWNLRATKADDYVRQSFRWER